MSKRSTTSVALAAGAAGLLVTTALTTAPAQAAASSVLVSDDFSRSVASGFGSADTGGAYTVPEKKDTSVNGTQAVLALAASVSRTALVGPSDAKDVEAVNSFGISALPTAGSVYLSQVLRSSSSGARLEPRLRIMPDKKIILGFRSVNAASAASTVGTDITLPFAMAANTRLMLRSQVEGTTVRAKAWAKGTAEPSSWQVTANSSAIPDAGRAGIWSYLGGGTNAINVSVDDLKVSTLATANVLPTAAFTRTVDDLDATFDASGSADSDGSIASYAWDFGDGSTGTGKSPTKKYAAPGTYTVKLTVTDDEGGKDSITKDVTAIAANIAPTAAFTESVTDLDVAFDASGAADSDGTIEAYTWNFGDGSTGTGKKPTKKYSAAGVYDVTLTVTDNRGGKASVTRPLTAVAPNVLPTAAFTEVVNDLDVSLDASGSADSDGTIASYAWDLGDGSTATGKTVAKKYAAAGPYNVKLTVKDNRGGEATATRTVTAIAPNVLPTAAFTSAVNDLDVAFDAGTSVDQDGTITTYAWDFGDGSNGTGRTAAKKYAAAGNYNVTLTVTDNRGGTATVTRQVTAIAPNVLPTAAFTQSVNDLDVAFDGGPSADSDGTITDYAWDFGDGSTGTGKNATKKYGAPGPYSVKLTVTDNRGGKASVTRTVTAIAPNVLPAAVFTESVNDLTVAFDAAGSVDSDGTITDYAWGFGDGSNGNGKTASKVYAAAGTYDVTLTVTDNRGGKSSVTRRVTAIAPNVAPTAGFAEVVNDLDVAFDAASSADSDGSITTYAWTFGDGSTGTGKTVAKKYAAPGQYNVTLTVTDNRGGTATVTRQVTAIAPNVLPTAAFTESVNDLAVAFDAAGSLDSDGTITDYAWGFGDGSNGNGKTANKTYSAPGTYAVTLTVTDNRGGKSTVTRQVTAVAANVLPSAAFTESVNNLSVAFDAAGSTDSDGTIASYAWEYGDGATGAGKTSSRTYAAAGTYSVKLTVTDNRGGTATVTRQVTATNPAPTKPTAANTGVPAGTPLTVHNGDLTITTPGTVIDGKDIRGYVAIKAANVTIKRSIIRGGAAATVNRALLAATQSGAGNFLIEDVKIAPDNPSPYINGINVNQSGTIRRADISGSVDGIMIYGSGVRVESSYLHDFAHYLNDPNWNGGPSHDDAIQIQAGTGNQIIGNSLSGAYNAAVMVTQDAGVTKDLGINGNWIDGGGCSINYGSNGAYKTGMQANNNRFGRNQRNVNCAIIHNSTKSDLVPTGNVWDDNGQPATIKKGS